MEADNIMHLSHIPHILNVDPELKYEMKDMTTNDQTLIADNDADGGVAQVLAEIHHPPLSELHACVKNGNNLGIYVPIKFKIYMCVNEFGLLVVVIIIVISQLLHFLN